MTYRVLPRALSFFQGFLLSLGLAICARGANVFETNSLSRALPATNDVSDQGEMPRSFPGGSWLLTVDPDAALSSIRINEILAINARGLRDEDQDTSAWIELYNSGSEPVNLGGWSLTDDPAVPDAWVFPDVTVEAGKYFLVYADGKDRTTNRNRLHTSFKLAVGGEYLGLYNLESPRAAVSEIWPGFPQQRADFSYGLNSSNGWSYFSPPTPGAANGDSAIAGAAEPVHFSVERGYFDAPFDVVLTCPTPGSTIRFTRDGSEPSGTNGAIYYGPVPVRATTVLRAAADSPGRIPSVIRTHTYLYGLPAGQRSLPALSIVTASNNLVGRSGIVGIGTGYYNPKNRGIAWERPISLEYITSDNSGFQEDCGIRLQASDYFRPQLTPSSKFSWRFYFRGDYGAGKLRYPLFPLTPVSEFDVLVCRGGSNDADNPFVKDEMMRRSLAACGQASAQGTFVALYIDGGYKGFYNPCERIESGFLQAHHGGGKFWDVMSQSGAIDGDNRDFNSMISFVKSKPMTTASNYQQMLGRLDVANFIDYLIVNAWGFNGDWPENNWRAGRERRAGALWRFYMWDAEFALGTYERPVTGNTFTEALSGNSEIASIHTRMKVNPEYKLLFADRIQKHFFNGGALDGAVLTNRFNAMYQTMSKIIPGMSRGILSWVSNRRKPLFTQFNAQGFLAGSNAPVFRVHGGTVPAGYSLSMTNRAGEIWYTTDGADPRVPVAGTTSPTARRYDPVQPPRLDAAVVVTARSFLTNSWSAVSEASFQVEDLGVPVRITEIMYDPPGGPEFEYVELTNPTDAAVNLTGYSFQGIGFLFPLTSILPPHTSWIIGSDANVKQFAVRYPGLAVAGRFKGSLANGGERLSLVDPSGNIVHTVDYQNQRGWPSAGNGTGRSLELVDIAAEPSAAESWIASEVGGSPGRYGTTQREAGVRIAEVLAQNEMAVPHRGKFPDWLELDNLSKDAVVLEGWRLGLADKGERFVFPAGTRLTSGGRTVIWGDSNVIPGELHSGIALPKEGATLVLERPDGTAVDVFSYGPQIADYAVGWIGAKRVLLEPTPGQLNVAATLASPTNLVINEWRANSFPGDDDFIEIYNRDRINPATVENLYVGVSNALFQIRSLTYIAAGGHRRFWADEHSGPDHLDFKLPATGATLKLLSEEGQELDRVAYAAAAEGLSRGRYPDGSADIVDFPSGATPGAANLLIALDEIQLNEILAGSQIHSGDRVSETDWIELRNPRAEDATLAGYSLRVSTETDRTWTIPSGVILAGGGYLQIRADATGSASTSAGNRLNTGWDLPDSGARVELKTPAGLLADEVVFGAQLPGRSIGRSADGWNLLSIPTPGASNAEPAATVSGVGVTINEWTTGSTTNSEDWIELFNANDLPAALGGYRLTDDPSTWAATHAVPLAPLTFIPPHGFVVLIADGRPGRGPAHLNFSLSGFGESLRLVTSSGQSINSATLVPLPPETSAGRVPDGGSFLSPLTRRSPGEPNSSDADGDGITDDWELANGLNPSDPRDADADADGDGQSNRAEYLAGTNPRSGASRLELSVVPAGTNQLQLVFYATAFHSYTVQYRDDLGSGNWLRVRDVPLSTREHLVEDVRVLIDRNKRWYRVMTPAMP